MNRKLQTLIENISRDVRARFPDFVLEVEPRGRKSAYIYMIAPDVRIWDDADVWDTVDEIAWKQLGKVIKDGYSIMLLPHQPLGWPGAHAPAVLREESPEWDEKPEDEAAEEPALRSPRPKGVGSLSKGVTPSSSSVPGE
jgi:hypothetical protein